MGLHHAHQQFFNRYSKLIYDELLNPNTRLISEIKIQPYQIISMSCELPMYAIFNKTVPERIYLLIPKKNLTKKYKLEMDILKQFINDQNTLNICVVTDPETNVSCYLYSFD